MLLGGFISAAAGLKPAALLFGAAALAGIPVVLMFICANKPVKEAPGGPGRGIKAGWPAWPVARVLLTGLLAARIGRLSDGPGGRLPLFLMSLAIAAGGFFLVPVHLPVPAWLAVIILVLAAATALTTLADALTTDAARKISSIALMTSYSVALDLGAAMGPLLSYLVIRLNHGLFLAYAGGALIFLLVACLWCPDWMASRAVRLAVARRKNRKYTG